MESAFAGLILDTSTLVTAERRGHSITQILESRHNTLGETEAGLSAITIVELAHGIERAQLEPQRQRRRAFVQDLRAALTVYPLTDEIAERAGTISGQQAEQGIILPFADLLIGATALHLGFEILTENTRPFAMIPNLVVKQI